MSLPSPKVDQTLVDFMEALQCLYSLVDGEEREYSVNWSALVDAWLDLIRPLWHAQLKLHRGNRVLRLKDLLQALIARPLETAQLQTILQHHRWTRPLDERIAAAIIGIPAR